MQVSPFGALQNLQNLSNIIVFQNYETFNNLAHGEFMEWVEKSLDINYKEAQRFTSSQPYQMLEKIDE